MSESPNKLEVDANKTFYDVTIVGRARHGKDTVASMLKVLDDRFTRVALADKLKEHLAWLLSESSKKLDIPHIRNNDPQYYLQQFDVDKNRYRPLLQWFGTDFVRKEDDKYWIKMLSTSIGRDMSKRYVLTDARFDNEVQSRIRDGNFIIKVVREGMEISESSHSSESGIDALPYHVLIKNDGSLDDLFKEVQKVYESFLVIT